MTPLTISLVLCLSLLDRELERTITALLSYGCEGEPSSSHLDTDAQLAKLLHDELNANVSHTRRRPSLTGTISEEELTRLKLQQFAHRDAIYRGNAEGPFGAKLSKKEAALPSPAKDFHHKKQKPMDRIAAEHAAFSSSHSSNRVASAEEIAAAQKGPAALKALRKRQAKAEEQALMLEAMGWIRPAGGVPASAVVPTSFAPSALQGFAGHEYASSAGHLDPHAWDSPRKEKKAESDRHKEEKKKKKKKKHHDDIEGEKKVKKEKKHKKDKEGKTSSSSSAAVGSSSSSSSVPLPASASVPNGTPLVDLLPEYSRTASISRSAIDAEQIQAAIKKG